jgi:hypothetical protein
MPFGALFGAAAAAAEDFRFVMQRLGEVTGSAPLREHPLEQSLPIIRSFEWFPWRGLDVGAIDSISGGALATAALYLLLRIPQLQMSLRIIDADVAARTNFNRYLLLFEELLGSSKVSALASFGGNEITIDGVERRFCDATLDELLPLAPRVLIGVDHIPSRWLAQTHAPAWLGIAATSHFEVVVSEHTPESPCAGCLHPHDPADDGGEIPTISFVSAFSGFLLAHRLLRSAEAGPTPSQTLAYPFNLGGEQPIWDLPLPARRDCPVGCEASR